MTNLVNQPNGLPTRKIAAVIIAGAVVGALQSMFGLLWPDFAATELLEQVDVWVQAGVMVAAGYLARDRA